MPDRTCWFIRLSRKDQPEKDGIGEIAPLQGLSLEDENLIEQELKVLISLIENSTCSLTSDTNLLENLFELQQFSSSVRFGAVMALLDLYHGEKEKFLIHLFSREMQFQSMV